MSTHPEQDERSAEAERLLDEFESQWRSGREPDVRAYLPDAGTADVRYLSGLIQLDLEYRWRRYASDAETAAAGGTPLPPFPKLEDYAALRPGLGGEILTPALAAEEYRARVRWGDRPDRSEFRRRFPDPRGELETALDAVEAEFQAERRPGGAGVRNVSGGGSTTVTQGGDESGTAPPAGPRQLGRYRLEAMIDRGGFGEVWRAYDPALDEHVAVKIPRPDRRFPPEVIAGFQREGRKLAAVRGVPGVVTVYDVGEADGVAYIVSRLIDGESLRARLKRGRPPHREAALLAAAVAETLHRAHLRGLVHRDVKPGNILLERDGAPVVADFGLAVTERDQLAEPAGAVGTDAYMPPEQVTGNSRLANPQADVYSLGVVLYEMLTGRLPFVADNAWDYRRQVVERPPWPPRAVDETIPAELERVCLKCLAKDPAARYTTARDLARDLRRWAAARKQPGRRWLPLVLASLAIAAAVLVLRPWREPRTPPGEPAPAKLPPPVRTSVTVPVPLDGARLLYSYDGPDAAVYEPVAEGLRINSQREAALLLYETDAVSYRFRVRFLLGEHRGTRPATFGLILGYGPEEGAEPGRRRFQTVRVCRWDVEALRAIGIRGRTKATLMRTVERGRLPDPHWPSFQTMDTMVNVSVPTDDEPGGHTLEVTVGPRGMEVVRYDGKEVPSHSSTEANEPTVDGDYRGGIGVINFNGTVTVTACEAVTLQPR